MHLCNSWSRIFEAEHHVLQLQTMKLNNHPIIFYISAITKLLLLAINSALVLKVYPSLQGVTFLIIILDCIIVHRSLCATATHAFSPAIFSQQICAYLRFFKKSFSFRPKHVSQSDIYGCKLNANLIPWFLLLLNDLGTISFLLKGH